MIIKPKVRGYICTTAHPLGCSRVVESNIAYVDAAGAFQGPKNVLVIGGSTGYGLASRIVTTFGAGAKTIGVSFEKAADEKRTATAGWYNTAAFEKLAHARGHYAKSINGDAFSHEIKQQTAELIRNDLKQIDLIVYSIASPRRVHPDTGEIFSSVLKPIGSSFASKTVDPFRREIKEVLLEPAVSSEIDHTVAVMGGEDWEMWIDFLSNQKLLAPGFSTVAYTYIGPTLTYPIYKEGTIGIAKEHLKQTALKLNQRLKTVGGRAFISVNKAVVTQASAAIPVVPLYISLLFKQMKLKGLHEGCIEQMVRLFKGHLCNSSWLNAQGMQDIEIRLDDLEMQKQIQEVIAKLWQNISTENLLQEADIDGYCEDFYKLFGFGMEDVDYELEVDPKIDIPSINMLEEALELT